MEQESASTNAPAASSPQAPVLSNVSLYNMSRDMKFMGVFYIIAGGLYSLTIVGALLGVPWLISGMRLRDSGFSFDSYAQSGDSNLLRLAIDQQSRYFRIQKIILIVALIIVVFGIAFAIIISLFFASHPDLYRS